MNQPQAPQTEAPLTEEIVDKYIIAACHVWANKQATQGMGEQDFAAAVVRTASSLLYARSEFMKGHHIAYSPPVASASGVMGSGVQVQAVNTGAPGHAPVMRPQTMATVQPVQGPGQAPGPYAPPAQYAAPGAAVVPGGPMQPSMVGGIPR